MSFWTNIINLNINYNLRSTNYKIQDKKRRKSKITFWIELFNGKKA